MILKLWKMFLLFENIKFFIDCGVYENGSEEEDF